LEFAINNNNADGVFGGTGPADQTAAAAVTTGMEFSIALADIGNPSPGSTIRIMAAVNNSDHKYLSNQFLGSFVPPQVNLGGDGVGGDDGTLDDINMNNFAGDQFFTLTVPGTPGLTGDHNDDGTVDAADYVAWRKTDGGNQAGYDAFRQQFGQTAVGSGGGAGVPEPATVTLIALATLAAFGLNRRR
jgi:hypothetical protein